MIALKKVIKIYFKNLIPVMRIGTLIEKSYKIN